MVRSLLDCLLIGMTHAQRTFYPGLDAEIAAETARYEAAVDKLKEAHFKRVKALLDAAEGKRQKSVAAAEVKRDEDVDGGNDDDGNVTTMLATTTTRDEDNDDEHDDDDVYVCDQEAPQPAALWYTDEFGVRRWHSDGKPLRRWGEFV